MPSLQEFKDALYKLNEKICSRCGKHVSAQGYIVCTCCLHGGCSAVPDEWFEKVSELKKHIEATEYLEKIGQE